MRKLILVLSLSLFFLFPSVEPAGVSLIPQAAAQDALILKCRKAVFRKYGRREVKGERRVRVMKSQQASSLIDQCVANGGRVD